MDRTRIARLGVNYMAGRTRHRGFGYIRKLPSGRYQASYVGHDDARHTAPETFTARIDAEAWLAAEHRRSEDPESWQAPRARIEAARKAAEAARLPTYADYAQRYLTERKVKGRPLAPSTVDGYRRMLANYINPTFGDVPLDEITPAMVNQWYDRLPADKERTRREAYTLARAVMTVATSAHGPLVGQVNPFAIRGGGSGTSPKREQIATAKEIEVILEHIRPEWRAMVLLALWCGMRYGELTELRRSDVDLDKRVIKIRRAVARAGPGKKIVKGPKSASGVRDQRIPAHIVPAITKHLRTYVTGRDGLLFPGAHGQHLHPARFQGKHTHRGWYGARKAAGRNDLRFHDLRATGATLLAQQGANIGEIQAFLGDSTPTAALRYVRAGQSRMDQLTERLSALAELGGW